MIEINIAPFLQSVATHWHAVHQTHFPVVFCAENYMFPVLPDIDGRRHFHLWYDPAVDTKETFAMRTYFSMSQFFNLAPGHLAQEHLDTLHVYAMQEVGAHEPLHTVTFVTVD